jgi:hypothetical protein
LRDFSRFNLCQLFSELVDNEFGVTESLFDVESGGEVVYVFEELVKGTEVVHDDVSLAVEDAHGSEYEKMVCEMVSQGYLRVEREQGVRSASKEWEEKWRYLP